MVTVEFTAPGFRMTLDVGAGAATLRLCEPTETLLGVDSPDVVVQRLRRALSDDVTRVGPGSLWEGRRLWWIATLPEGWARLYLALDDRDRILVCMAPDNSVLGEARLSPMVVAAWKEVLDRVAA